MAEGKKLETRNMVTAILKLDGLLWKKKGMPVSWEAQEISDCITDFQDFGDKMLKSLDVKFQKVSTLVF